MNKIVPHAKWYKVSIKLSKLLNYLVYISTIISVIIIISKNFFPNSNQMLINWITKGLAAISVSYFIIGVVQRFSFNKAELERKNDLIDNSLNSNLNSEKSENYFSNNNIEHSIFKLGVDCFENSYFTKSISEKMLVKQLILNSIVVLIIVTLLLTTSNNLTVEIFLLALPYSISNETIRLYWLNKEMEDVFSEFKKIFDSVSEDKIEVLIINNVINYEKSLSSNQILLNSNIFEQMNDELSKQWKALKVKYEIR